MTLPRAFRLEARALGHPLLPDDVRVPNDVTLGPPGKFLFITGSNMSGKSTPLRAIGVNTVLAQAGAPVCAERLASSPVALASVIRIDDSLVDGISLLPKFTPMSDVIRNWETTIDWAIEAFRQAATEDRLNEFLTSLLGVKEQHCSLTRAVRQLLS